LYLLKAFGARKFEVQARDFRGVSRNLHQTSIMVRENHHDGVPHAPTGIKVVSAPLSGHPVTSLCLFRFDASEES
jgi:hypothetical protein